MSDIAKLIEQLDTAAEPSRWIDAKIDAVFRIGALKMQGDGQGYEWAWSNFPQWAAHKQARGMCGVQHDNGDLGLIWDSMQFTASLDAALVLFNASMPGWTIARISQDDRKEWHVELRKGFLTSYSTVQLSGAKTPAIALCIAILKAKQAQEVSA